MRLVINLVLIALIAGLIWVLYSTIQEPIEFKSAREAREDAVISRLMEIRQAQEIFRSVNGGFAPSFDSLREVLETGKIMIVAVEGDPDDPTGAAITYDTSYVAAMAEVKEKKIKLDSLEFVPYSTKGDRFTIQADTLTYQQTLVHVVEVGTKYTSFMGKYGVERYARYDKSYSPSATIKFGDMYTPSLAGNWER